MWVSPMMMSSTWSQMIELTVDGKRSIAIVTQQEDKLYTLLWMGEIWFLDMYGIPTLTPEGRAVAIVPSRVVLDADKGRLLP